ncbi:MAG TPA: cysteine desulfurase family protein [Verrucomicrobiota bacterium]|nr:cysteine desulfurase NifS [Verrucomicrobiales bacterium]HRI16387.1 cysteine desulfurase family protein [Verrucomicrobiota bacterium]
MGPLTRLFALGLGLCSLRHLTPTPHAQEVRPIYFDYNATTPLDPQVREAMLPFLDSVWGNPSSVHQIGRTARAALDDARYRLAELWGCKPSEVVFTSGGTEANNLAVFGTARLRRDRGRHLISTPIEHHAVLHAIQHLASHEGFEVTWLPVDSTGRVAPEDVVRALRPDTILVSVMAANNEIGTLQPVTEIGPLCRERGIAFHTDAVQAFGKLPFTNIHQFNADLVAVCGHKFFGPKGAGALYIRSPLQPQSVQVGGGHENERRAGTENLPAIVGLVEAFARGVRPPVFPETPLREWTQRLATAAAAIPGVTLRGHPQERLANTLAFSVAGTDSIALMAALDLEGVCASSGSACSAGSIEPSHVLKAIGVPAVEANALVRFSLGRENTEDEVRRVIELLPEVVRRVCQTDRPKG